MPDGWRPDTRQRIQRATRFFARPESFTLECPKCGKVYQIRMGIKNGSWDPNTSRFTCRGKGGCNKTFVIGLLAWPVVNAPRVASTTPRDQVPHERQLVQLRSEGGGFWLADVEAKRHQRTDESNLTLEEERDHDEDDEE